jgi:putative tryptophan/tyrosine transport system substrate-binding protein
MQGDFSYSRKAYRGLVLFWLWLLPLTIIASENNILIIKSNENSFFNQSIEKLINMTEHNVKFNIINAKIFEKNPQNFQPGAIITLGYRAAQLTTEIEEKIPVIHSYLTEFQLKSHGMNKPHYSVLLDQPIERYFHFIKRLLDIESVGLLKTSDNSYGRKKLKRLERSTALKINQYIFNPDENHGPVSTVRNILQTNDVLLSLPDPTIFNHQTLKGVLLASYRLNKPVISYSPSHVNSGALAAIYTSPPQIGEQLANILNKLLEGKLTPKDHKNYANNFEIKINRQVAHSLNIELPSDDQIISQMRSGEFK